LALTELPPPAVAVASPAVSAIAAQTTVVAIVRRVSCLGFMSCFLSVEVR
jgi:hypothetical protein